MEYVIGTYILGGMIIPLILARLAEKRGYEPLAIHFVWGSPGVFFLFGLAFWPIWIALELFKHSTSAKEKLISAKREANLQSEVIKREENQNRFRGKTGIAITPLRPYGTIEIENQRFEAKSASGLVPVNSNVTIIDYSNGYPIVQKI